jgi:hypothetical protein
MTNSRPEPCILMAEVPPKVNAEARQLAPRIVGCFASLQRRPCPGLQTAAATLYRYHEQLFNRLP